MNIYKGLLCAALAVAASFSANAQNQQSPYSRFGYGMIGDFATSAQRNMGGVGIAMADGRQINVMNPASYAAADSLTLHWDIGIDLTQLKSEENGNTGKSFGGGLDYMTLQFPIGKRMGGSIGLVPYTTVGYSFGNDLKNDVGGTTGSESISGYGGLNNLYAGFAARPFDGLFNGTLDGLSLGVNVAYQFGTIVNDTYIISTSQSLFEQVVQVRDWDVTLGLQYAYQMNKHRFGVGFTYSPKKDFHGKSWAIKYDVSGDSKPDTINEIRLRPEGYARPNAFAFGLNYVYNRSLMVEADFALQQWGKVNFPGISYHNKGSQVVEHLYQANFADRYKAGVGVQYIPRERGSFLQRIAYRLGGSYTRDYIMVGDNNVREYTLGCGFGLPTMAQKTMINIGFEWKHRQAYPASLVSENYYSITLSINYKEMAFWKDKIR